MCEPGKLGAVKERTLTHLSENSAVIIRKGQDMPSQRQIVEEELFSPVVA